MSQEDIRNELFERNDRRNAGDRGQETQEEKSHRLLHAVLVLLTAGFLGYRV